MVQGSSELRQSHSHDCCDTNLRQQGRRRLCVHPGARGVDPDALGDHRAPQQQPAPRDTRWLHL